MEQKAKFIMLTETASTNTYAAKVGDLLPSGTVIATFRQTAGRGQRGNKWESEPGKNITLTALVKGSLVAPAEQFMISEAVSMAVVDVLSRYTDGISVKWPNDIYWHDKKICGILIEHTLSGNRIDRTIIGAGVNINQMEFRSDAPNPVSLAQIIGRELDLEAVTREVGCAIVSCTATESVDGKTKIGGLCYDDLHSRYLASLYWRDGKFHPFELPDGTGILAKIDDVYPDGRLSLCTESGERQLYYFKEISFCIGK